MRVSDAFPSDFLKASDLNNQEVTVTIAQVSMEDIGQGREKDSKLVVGFSGKSKRLVCNKTNAGTIVKLHGDDTDNWIGKRITLCAREVEFQGDMVWAIRVSLKAPPSSQPSPKAEPPTHHNLQSPPPVVTTPVGENDDVPF